MAFDVSADAYTRFMGRFSGPLSDELLRVVSPEKGQRALDVGCGPGALTSRLASVLGESAVAAVDPSGSFVTATSALLPGADVRRASAEELPFGDDAFDLTLAQLVVLFMRDPVAGLTEMARVTRPGGVVAASVWDHAGGGGPLSVFWDAVGDVEPGHLGESELPGTGEGELAELFTEAGIGAVSAQTLTVTVAFPTFEDWWRPFMLGVGPAGDHVARLSADGVVALRDAARRRLPAAPFELAATAWLAVGTA